jgi:GT2 family glycosyltransferase
MGRTATRGPRTPDLTEIDPDLVESVFDAEFYLTCHPDVRTAGLDPFEHFMQFGLVEERAPSLFFDPRWYAQRYTEVARSGANPLVHYLEHGGRELRDPHPGFDAAFYVDRHPEAAANPLIHYMLYGTSLGYATRRIPHIPDYLPSGAPSPPPPPGLVVDIIIPVYRGLRETRRCINAVLADPERPAGRIIVIDDRSPEPKLSEWLGTLSRAGQILLLRNAANLGFVASVNRGLAAAEGHDVVLLNSDTEPPPGWVTRLAGHAYAGPRVASVSPFSNNATICSYPRLEGGPPPLGLPVAALDAAAREANGGRSVRVPVTVGFCMFIRHDALRDVGNFDAQTFGRGYGEETDFCMRADARGWTHRLACDIYVHHDGEVSFGPKSTEAVRSQDILRARYPGYDRLIDRHVRVDDAGPARFALTAALFRRSGLPTILHVSHNLGGGVRHHIDQIDAQIAGRANVLLLEGAGTAGGTLSVPTLPGHPRMAVAPDRLEDALAYLRSAGVTRVHVHHTLALGLDLRRLIALLDVPFDVTVHDWFMICPQVNLLPQLDGPYCGEPGPEICNACIADRPAGEARDITAWRASFRWLFLAADRVLCPSHDVRSRLERHGLAERAVVVPHEPVTAGSWGMVQPPAVRGGRLRIAIIGVLADQKGLPAALAVAQAAEPDEIELHLVGYTEKPLAPEYEGLIHETGRYENADLPRLLARIKPHVIWFPASWPETYSYTLSAAIETGLPIVASDIGSFPERLAGRPLTWLVHPAAPPDEWLAVFDALRADITTLRTPPRGKPRAFQPDYYADGYLPSRPAGTANARSAAKPGGRDVPRARIGAPLDLRRPGRTAVLVVPERGTDGGFSPCAYIRLLLPLDHPDAAGDIEVLVADPEEALRYRADIVLTQRYALPDLAATDALAAHAAATGARLVYDLDDDLANIPDEHPEAAILRPRAERVRRLIARADTVLVSTPGLAANLASLRADTVLVPNGLDERLWNVALPPRLPRAGPVRFLLMGTATHDHDIAMLMPALRRLHEAFASRVAIDVIGMTTRDLPDWMNRVVVPPTGGASYPAFVNWITRQPPWHIGLTPLADTAFNAGKSAIKAMDYAALGLAVLASDVPAYRGSLADPASVASGEPSGEAAGDPSGDPSGEVAGQLVRNTPAAWFQAMADLVRSPDLWGARAEAARAAFLATATLRSQAALRRKLWMAGSPAARATARPMARPIARPRAQAAT